MQRIPGQFDVAIVGGGVVGWSVAWQLKRREPSLRVVVIEPDPEASSALRGTGGARAQFANRVHIEMSLASIEMLKRFKEETGCDIGFRQAGYLLFTAQHERAAAMGEAVQLQRECGVPVQELNRFSIASLAPYLRTDDLVYGTISYSDGVLSAPDLLRGYRNAAACLGAEELRGLVTAPPERDGDGWVVRSGPTQDDELQSGEVVIATGHNSAMFGLPVRPECHQLFTRPDPAGIPDGAPMTVDCDTSFHFRRKGAGIVMGYNDPVLTQLSPPLARGGGRGDSGWGSVAQPEFDSSVFARAAEAGRPRCPQLFEGWAEPVGWAGCYSVTPDHRALLGRLDGLVIATGFGGHGVMHSPAAGRIVAALILDGKSSIDISELNPERFRQADYVPNTEGMIF